MISNVENKYTMRKLLSILSEAKLQARDFYVPARLEKFIDMIQTGESFQTLEGEPIELHPSPQEMKLLKALLKYLKLGGDWNEVKNDFPKSFGGIKLSMLFKTGEFGGQGGEIGSGVASGVVKANIGETVEALKAIAIFTKLTTRNKTEITAEDVVANIKQAAASSTDTGKVIHSKFAVDVPDNAGNVKDHIALEILLKRAPFQRAMAISPEDKDAWGRLAGIVSYVNNEADLAKYNRFFANNQRRDPVDIEVRGLEGEKADVATTYTDAQGNRRPLSHLSMSIKAGSAKYEQASGLNEAGNIKFFNILGLSIDDARSAMASAKFAKGLPTKEKTASVVQIYTQAATMLATKLAPMDDTGEANFINTLLNNLKAAIRGDQRLVYVNFDANGTYYKLNPELIINLAKYVDLEANLVQKKWPYLYVVDKKSSKALFHVRLAVNASGRLTHVFELDNLLTLVKEATAAANVIQQPQQVQQPQPEISENRETRIIISPLRERR